MSPPSEGRTSADQGPGEGGYNSWGGYRQNPHQPSNQLSKEASNQPSSGRANGFGPADGQRQRYAGQQNVGDQRNLNGSQAPSVDGRNGWNRELAQNTQNMPVREKSRTNGTPSGAPGVGSGSRPTNGSSRTCKKCDQSLTGQFVRALGGTYHLECFLCRVSSKIHCYLCCRFN